MSLLSHYPVSVLSRTALLISYDKSLQLTLEIIPHFLLPIKPSLSPPPGEELDHKALTLAKNIPRGKHEITEKQTVSSATETSSVPQESFPGVPSAVQGFP